MGYDPSERFRRENESSIVPREPITAVKRLKEAFICLILFMTVRTVMIVMEIRIMNIPIVDQLITAVRDAVVNLFEMGQFYA